MIERARNAIIKIKAGLSNTFAPRQPILKETIQTNGGRIIASSHPGEINEIIDKRNRTLGIQKERKNKPVADPIFEITPGEDPETTDIKLTYKGQEYSFTSSVGASNISEFTEKLKNYLPKATECTTCDKIFFPGESVAEDSKGLMHLTMDCCPAGILFTGRMNTEGNVVTPQTVIEEGEFINHMTFSYPDDEEIESFYS